MNSNIPKFSSKEEPVFEFLIEFYQKSHTNALAYETWLSIEQRLEYGVEPASMKKIIVYAETDEEALKTAKYHFYLTGENFFIISKSLKK